MYLSDFRHPHKPYGSHEVPVDAALGNPGLGGGQCTILVKRSQKASLLISHAFPAQLICSKWLPLTLPPEYLAGSKQDQ